MKNVIITGASSGIGKATVDLFNDKVYRTIGIARRDCVGCDVYVNHDLKDTIKTIEILKHLIDTYGEIDVLINNAGYMPLQNFTIDERKKYIHLMMVNLDAVYFLTEYITRTQKKKCSIINISSVSGTKADPDSIPYGISKAGVISLTKSFAKLYPNHRINCISPGFIDTDIAPRPVPKELMDTIVIGRVGTTDEIAKLIYNVVQNDFMTGTNIIFDGGCSL